MDGRADRMKGLIRLAVVKVTRVVGKVVCLF